MDSVLLPQSIYHNPVLNLNDVTKKEIVNQITSDFVLTQSVLKRVQNTFIDEINLGLALKPNRKSSLLMANTFIPEMPNGSESGDFISLDLGTTNFRVVLSQLRPETENKFTVKYYTVPNEFRRGESKNLFDFLAECIADFVSEYLPNNINRLPLGFTFSFPMIQKALDIGILETWTKNFDCPDAVGRDAAHLLQKAISMREDLNVDIVAILNDSTGTLIKGVYLDPECAIGLILGTGSNACYLEKSDKIEKWVDRDEAYANVKETVINMECGGFGDNGVIDFVKTKFDRDVDRDSLFPNSYTFEKYFSGHYLGDIVRRVIIALVQEKALLNGCITDALRENNSITSSDVSIIEGDESQRENSVQILAKRLGYEVVSNDDIEIIRYVCSLISIRGALLLSAIMATLIERIDKPNVTIAIDGSVYKNHPKFHQLMTDFISQLIPGKKFKLILAEDGSGKGAGLVAAIGQRFKNKNK